MLKGYKEICRWIEQRFKVELSEKECCKYSNWQHDPLPVIRPWKGRQSTGRVFAKTEEVERWCRAHFVVLR